MLQDEVREDEVEAVRLEGAQELVVPDLAQPHAREAGQALARPRDHLAADVHGRHFPHMRRQVLLDAADAASDVQDGGVRRQVAADLRGIRLAGALEGLGRRSGQDRVVRIGPRRLVPGALVVERRRRATGRGLFPEAVEQSHAGRLAQVAALPLSRDLFSLSR